MGRPLVDHWGVRHFTPPRGMARPRFCFKPWRGPAANNGLFLGVFLFGPNRQHEDAVGFSEVRRNSVSETPNLPHGRFLGKKKNRCHPAVPGTAKNAARGVPGNLRIVVLRTGAARVSPKPQGPSSTPKHSAGVPGTLTGIPAMVFSKSWWKTRFPVFFFCERLRETHRKLLRLSFPTAEHVFFKVLDDF